MAENCRGMEGQGTFVCGSTVVMEMYSPVHSRAAPTVAGHGCCLLLPWTVADLCVCLHVQLNMKSETEQCVSVQLCIEVMCLFSSRCMPECSSEVMYNRSPRWVLSRKGWLYCPLPLPRPRPRPVPPPLPLSPAAWCACWDGCDRDRGCCWASCCPPPLPSSAVLG